MWGDNGSRNGVLDVQDDLSGRISWKGSAVRRGKIGTTAQLSRSYHSLVGKEWVGLLRRLGGFSIRAILEGRCVFFVGGSLTHGVFFICDGGAAGGGVDCFVAVPCILFARFVCFSNMSLKRIQMIVLEI